MTFIKNIVLFGGIVIMLGFAACTNHVENTNSTEIVMDSNQEKGFASSKGQSDEEKSGGMVTAGTEEYRGFIVDNVLHSLSNGDIHYNVYIPDSYNGKTEYALFITLPGYQGLYFQGVAENLKTEEFGFEAQKYNEKMIIFCSCARKYNIRKAGCR